MKEIIKTIKEILNKYKELEGYFPTFINLKTI